MVGAMPLRRPGCRQPRGCTTTSSTGAGRERPIRTRPISTAKKSTLSSVRSLSHSRVRRCSSGKRGETHSTTADSSDEALMISSPRWLSRVGSSLFSTITRRPCGSVPSTCREPWSTWMPRRRGVISMPRVWPSRSRFWVNQGIRSGRSSPQNEWRSSRSRRPRPSLSISISADMQLHSFWGDALPDLMPWFTQNLDLLGQTLGMEITPLRRGIQVDQGSLQVLGTDPQGRLVIVENKLEPTRDNHLGELIINASSLESAVVLWVSPRFPDEHRRTLEWLNDRTDDKVDFFAVEIGLVRIGRSLPAPVLDVVVQPRGWRQPGRRSGVPSTVPVATPGYQSPLPASPLGNSSAPSPTQMPPPLSTQPSSQLSAAMPPSPPPAGDGAGTAQPPPMASDKDGGFATAEVRHGFFEAMFE